VTRSGDNVYADIAGVLEFAKSFFAHRV
jgi:hypothetical protein